MDRPMKISNKSSRVLHITGDSSRTGAELSIVIPMFNEADGIAELFSRLESVIANLDRSTELVLVDDGSTDSTWLDINAYRPINFRLRLYRTESKFWQGSGVDLRATGRPGQNYRNS